MHTRSTIAALVCSAAALSGQGTPDPHGGHFGSQTLPPALAGKEGAGATNLPFGRSLPLRMQVAYDVGMLPGFSLIKRLEMRRDQAFAAQAKTPRLRLHVGTLPGSLTQLSSVFRSNLGPDLREVLPSRRLSLPGLSQLASRTHPVDIPFVQAFAYQGTAPLLFDFRVEANARGAYRLDASGTCRSPLDYYGPPGCAVSPSAAPLQLVSRTQNIMWGNDLVLSVENALPGKLTLLFFGLQGSGVWNGIPLPFDAGVIGAPGCHLSTSVLYAPRRPADQRGRADYGFTLPELPSLQGFAVTAQAVADAPRSNPLGAVSSQAAWIRICGGERVGRVFSNGLQSSLGARELGVAPVLRLSSH